MSPPAARRVFPRRLTVRWFATRGWAFGAGVTFLLCAVLFRPESFSSEMRVVMPVLFGLAGGTLIGVGYWPECLRLRLVAVTFAVTVTLARCWTLLFGPGDTDTRTRVAAGVVWLFIAYACWLLATLTAKIPSRR